uniref:Family with sequence similarity 177 member A1 n=1 Tax=Accipiter nisus TaxID=211598 RepID=A0A8B9N1P6_9AVES
MEFRTLWKGLSSYRSYLGIELDACNFPSMGVGSKTHKNTVVSGKQETLQIFLLSLFELWHVLLCAMNIQLYVFILLLFLQTTLTWGPYLWFHMLRVATSTLSVCDFLGEKIASVLGISTPKYQYAIDEYYRMKREEEEEEQENKMSEEAERQHREQQNKPQAEAPVQTDQPEATACTSFVNVNFENEGDCQSIGENKQDVVPVPP